MPLCHLFLCLYKEGHLGPRRLVSAVDRAGAQVLWLVTGLPFKISVTTQCGDYDCSESKDVSNKLTMRAAGGWRSGAPLLMLGSLIIPYNLPRETRQPHSLLIPHRVGVGLPGSPCGGLILSFQKVTVQE